MEDNNQMKIFNKNHVFLKYVFFPIVIFIVFLRIYISLIPTVTIRYGDEHDWIWRSYHFDLLLKKDFTNNSWNTAKDQPTLAEYIYGIVLYPKYLQELKKHNGIYKYEEFLIDNNFYIFEQDTYGDYKNKVTKFINWDPELSGGIENSVQSLIDKYSAEFKKTIDIVLTARIPNAFFLALTAILVYYIAIYTFNWITAVLSSVLFGFNSFVINVSLRAQADGLFMFLFCLSVLLLLLMRNYKNRIIYILFFAISIGLITQTKINGVMMGIFYNIYILTIAARDFIKKRYAGLLNNIKSFLIVNIIAFSVFVILNPFLYSNPFKNTFKMYQWRNNVTNKQMIKYSDNALPTFGERIKSIYDYYLKPSKIETYRNFNRLIFLDNAYSKRKLYYSIFIKTLSMLGLVLFAKRLIRQFQKKKIDNASLLFLLFLFTQIVMGFYLKLNFDKYYIQLALFFSLFPSIAIDWLLCKFLIKKSENPITS